MKTFAYYFVLSTGESYILRAQWTKCYQLWRGLMEFNRSLTPKLQEVFLINIKRDFNADNFLQAANFLDENIAEIADSQ